MVYKFHNYLNLENNYLGQNIVHYSKHIPDLIYDNRGNYTDAINTVLGGNNTGGVSNFTIDADSGNQPSSDFKIQPSFDYRSAAGRRRSADMVRRSQ